MTEERLPLVELLARDGTQNGTRAMVTVVALGGECGPDRPHTAVGMAMAMKRL